MRLRSNTAEQHCQLQAPPQFPLPTQDLQLLQAPPGNVSVLCPTFVKALELAICPSAAAAQVPATPKLTQVPEMCVA